MLTSFFGKSAPLNFVLLGSYIFIICLLYFVLDVKVVFDLVTIGKLTLIVALLVFSILLLDFTIRKNGLTLLNTYAIFIFSCSAGMLCGFIEEPNMVITNVFLLLALRRMFSLQASKNSERKILDASIWILLASVFYFWSILLLIGLYAAISLKPQKLFRHYLVPLAGIIGVFLIATAYHFITEQSFGWFVNWLGDASFDFSNYAQIEMLIFISFMAALLVWTLISKIKAISSGSKKSRPNNLLEVYILVVLVSALLFASDKTGDEFLLLLAPASIIIAGYIERESDKWFKETLLWAFVLLPISFIFI
ncbi:MAG: DUF6427 family protein [Bacteroidota bacterium]